MIEVQSHHVHAGHRSEAVVEVRYHDQDGTPQYLRMEFSPYEFSVDVELEAQDYPDWERELLSLPHQAHPIRSVDLSFSGLRMRPDGLLVRYYTRLPDDPDPELAPADGTRVINGVSFTQEQWDTAKRVLLGKKARQ